MYAWGEGLYADFAQLESDMRWEGETFELKSGNKKADRLKKEGGTFFGNTDRPEYYTGNLARREKVARAQQERHRLMRC
jgi:hypothetical protein